MKFSETDADDLRRSFDVTISGLYHARSATWMIRGRRRGHSGRGGHSVKPLPIHP